MIQLRYSPYRVFTASTSPAGLYARKKWLGQEKGRAWQGDYRTTVALLLKGQSGDGDWRGSFLATVRNLFGLHLTVREPDETIRWGLEWLFSRSLGDTLPGSTEKELSAIACDNLEGLPFVAGEPRLLALAMTLFLASIFGKGDDAAVRARYDELSRQVLAGSGGPPGSAGNLLRAFAVNAAYAGGPATALLVERLTEIRDAPALRSRQAAFYRTVNALAHLRLPAADRLLGPAFRILGETQNPDGTWGAADQEWNTFLVVHALRNRNILKATGHHISPRAD